jgi:hypothetical protein
MFRRSICAILGIVFLVTGFGAFGAQPVDSRSAGRWLTQPGWTPSRLATAHRVEADGDWLKFSAVGQGKQMTWTLVPEASELAGEPRYLVVTYRAEKLDGGSKDHFLASQFGGSEWIRLIGHDRLVADGQPHVLAVDMFSHMYQAPLDRLMLRIGPTTGEEGRLWAKLEWVDQLPEGVTALAAKQPKSEVIRLVPKDQTWSPSANWTPRPAAKHSMQAGDIGMRFAMEGARCSMRWSAKLATTIDLRKLPYVSIRYRARGEFGTSGYVVHLSAADSEGDKISVHAMQPGDVIGDGKWHVFTRRMPERGVAKGTIAMGVDSLSPTAEIEVDYIQFTSTPPLVPLGDIVEFKARAAAWPDGQDGLRTVALPDADRPNVYLPMRMGLGQWFPTAEITIGGIPFRVPASFEKLPATGTVDEDSLVIPLPSQAKEILVLLLASFPNSEETLSARSNRPLQMLDEPERAFFELRYQDGTVDRMLAVHAATGKYGIAHGTEVYALRPSPGKELKELAFCDRMRNACFGLAGVTVNNGQPRVAEPQIAQLWYPTRPAPAEAPASVDLEGMTWRAIRSSILPGGTIELAKEPLFRLDVGDRTITSQQFTVEKVDTQDGKRLVRGRFQDGAILLEACLDLQPEGQAGTRMALTLSNAGKEPLTGTLRFPTVAGLKVGKVEDTWYFGARRGGVIHHVPRQFRDEIGEAHPLQVDGFFNPEAAVGVCFMPRDLEGVFRWYRLGKDDAGGSYALEYLPQTLTPGKPWQSVPVVVQVVPGDWRDQLHVYRNWVKSWHKPLAARKDWFRRLWAFPTYGPNQSPSQPLDERLDLVGLAQRRNSRVPASTDYMHLYGWAISKEYGHWGGYHHFHQYGGDQGKERFIEAVRRCQAAGIPVGLYLDGYLVSTKSDKPSKADVEKWAVRTADGKMLYHKNYDAHSMCPYVPEWREHLVAAYRRLAEEIRPDGMYLDEFGKCMVSRICYSHEHGHPSPVGMSPGEWLLTRQIREAIPEKIATYCEFVPADVATQYIDGAYGHVSLNNYREGYADVAPHFVNLHRFALPDFKSFELIYYAGLRNGNWFLLKYPFFNGDGYYLTGGELAGYDDHSRSFLTRVFNLQHEHADAFTSKDVDPLVPTAQPGLYANRFSTERKCVWTLWNANYRTARGTVLTVPHVAGAQYFDAWNERPIAAKIQGEQATLELEIGPRSVGCIVQHRP